MFQCREPLTENRTSRSNESLQMPRNVTLFLSHYTGRIAIKYVHSRELSLQWIFALLLDNFACSDQFVSNRNHVQHLDFIIKIPTTYVFKKLK